MQFIYTHGGVFPVRRGARDEETFITAETILARGGAITMYCEGGRSRTGKLAEQAKPGIGRLALETGAPVVPIAIHGSSRVRNWKRLQFPKVTVQYGEPMRWEASRTPRASSSRRSPTRSSRRSARLYGGLEQHGRQGILRRVREQRRARAQRRAPSGAARRHADEQRPRRGRSSLDVGAVIRRVFDDLRRAGAGADARGGGRVRVHRHPRQRPDRRPAPGSRLLALLIGLVASTLFTGMVVELVADVQDGRRDATPGQLLRAATPVLGQLILVGVVAGVGDRDRLHPAHRARA